MATLLEGLNAPDLGLLLAQQDFAAVTDMSEEFTQDVGYDRAFGHTGPVLRRVQPGDSGTVTFTAVLLKKGVAKGLNSEKVLGKMKDFEVITKRGDEKTVYTSCNWTRISVRSAIDRVTLDCDISVPGIPQNLLQD